MTGTKSYKLVVRVIIEAQTPLCIGSGEKSILTDSEVMRDVNGLPYIPGQRWQECCAKNFLRRKLNTILVRKGMGVSMARH